MSIHEICLPEYQPVKLPKHDLTNDDAMILLNHYSKQVEIEFPTPKTGGQWQLTSKGWVGYIPLSSDLAIKLEPKVPIGNLFRMWEYAYRLKSVRILSEYTTLNSLSDVYENLAIILARKILDRSTQGLYRSYQAENEVLSCIRGRLDTAHLIQRPWVVNKRCHYEENTADNEDNQILLWTLYIIARSGLCGERSLNLVRRALRVLTGSVTLQSFSAHDCIGRNYNRLNADYRQLHALCRFFLEQTGPDIKTGDHVMLPFLVYMPKLYELFVAEWLREHLPAKYQIKDQKKVVIGNIELIIDLVVTDVMNNRVACIADTKYKASSDPTPDDFSQVVTYAVAENSNLAVLIYPKANEAVFDEQINNIRVCSLIFDLDDDIESAGQNMLNQLLDVIQSAEPLHRQQFALAGGGRP